MSKKKKTVRENMLSVLPKMSISDEYYSIREIFKRYALYYMIWGERSNGKTYSVLEFALWCYWLFGYELAIIRRWAEDFKGKAGAAMFKNHINNDLIRKITNGEWTSVYYYSSRWYLCKYEDGRRICMDEPFAYAFALSYVEHDKSTAYPDVKVILFDEFISRDAIDSNEFIDFTNTLSTIIRDRGDAVIFMCGNTVNQYCPYFQEMGITNAKKMKQGTIDIYNYGKDEELVVACEYCGTIEGQERKKKKSDKYFAFNNPKLNMIKTGSWEIALYPHLPIRYKPSDILYTYFIKFNGDLVQCEIIQVGDNFFTYAHEKTTPLQDRRTDLIFSTEYNPLPNYRRRISKPVDDLGKKIYWFYVNEKVFYQHNELGEVVRNYLMWSKNDRGII